MKGREGLVSKKPLAPQTTTSKQPPIHQNICLVQYLPSLYFLIFWPFGKKFAVGVSVRGVISK